MKLYPADLQYKYILQWTRDADAAFLGMMDILDDLKDLPATLLKMLKVIKFLTMDAMTLDPLQRAGAIPKLVDILNHKFGAHVTVCV